MTVDARYGPSETTVLWNWEIFCRLGLVVRAAAVGSRFSARGVDIHDYTVQLDQATHEAIHAGYGTWEGSWNTQIMETLLGRMLTPEEIVNVGTGVMRDYGIGGRWCATRTYEPGSHSGRGAWLARAAARASGRARVRIT